MSFDQLLLKNQLCFPIYATSRLITRTYQPYFDELGITYPQYLVLLVLWEQDNCAVNDIAERLILNTNTITPLLKRMEKDRIINRIKSTADERKVIISLTEKGRDMEARAAEIPFKVAQNLQSDDITMEEIIDLRNQLNRLISTLNKNHKENQF